MNLRRLLQGATLLSVIGLGISLYLTYIYTADKVALCLSGGGCDTVQHSPYAWIMGIPLPTLGAGAYLLLIGLGLLAMRESDRRQTWLLGLFGVSLVGLLFSGYLTVLEMFVIKAYCSWCLISAAIQLVVFALALLAWRRDQAEEA